MTWQPALTPTARRIDPDFLARRPFIWDGTDVNQREGALLPPGPLRRARARSPGSGRISGRGCTSRSSCQGASAQSGSLRVHLLLQKQQREEK
ncbi:hypothetical protein NDU88_001943 [Pleurodeles waltl]|uniref:Uncharacterized protein n=1 Tax=Pleurodeles waltl TaxID=8319 RepID=A0AAV7M2K4_PLEWA|nr:hypothetical protein NDU88_001943 [Pleurodeles waltl]